MSSLSSNYGPGSRIPSTYRNPANRHLHDTASEPDGRWHDVTSSSKIVRIRYFGPGWFDALDVEFKLGKIARYENVPWSVWFGFLNAPSKGTYHWQVIRNSGKDDKAGSAARYPFFYI